MKNSKKVFVAIVLFVISLMNVQAQDVITMKGGETLNVKITELNENQIKYYETGDASQLIFTVPRALVKEIQFSYGKKHLEKAPSENNQHYFTGDRRNMLKVNFTGLLNSPIISYERSMKPSYSFETNLKLIGKGIEGQRNSVFGSTKTGFAIDFGAKFKTKSILKKSGEYRPRHILHGGYFKPVVGINFLKFNFEGVNARSKTVGNVGIDLGKQWVFSNLVTLDAFIGYHYLIGNTETQYYDNYGYSYYQSDRLSIGDLEGYKNSAISFGVKVGFLFNDLKKK